LTTDGEGREIEQAMTWVAEVEQFLIAIHNHDNLRMFDPGFWNNVSKLDYFAERADKLLQQLAEKRKELED